MTGLFEQLADKLTTVPESGCWLWIKSLSRGYARSYIGKKFVQVHRAFYEHYVGPIPEGLVLDHLCRVKNCCNPAHLEAVTEQVNILRGTSASAKNARKTHCPKGHELSGDNLYVDKDGFRRCRKCRRDWDRQQYAISDRGHHGRKRP